MNTREQYCTFFLDDLFFGIEVDKVQEVIRYLDMTSVPLAPNMIAGLINLRGQIVAAIDLRRRLGLAEDTKQNTPMNVVVRSDDGPISLLVDEIGEVVNAESDQFEAPPETLRGTTRELVRGVYKLQDRLLIVLDSTKLFQFGESGPEPC